MHSNAFLYPTPGLTGRLVNRLVACPVLRRARRTILSRLPFMPLASDVTDVVYCTWLVRTECIARLVPPGVTLVEHNEQTLFTILTYRHRHFGPALAGPLRGLFPSPLQSNWRLYLESFPEKFPAGRCVLFVKNIFDQPLHAIASRLFSDALPSHLALNFEHEQRAGAYRTRIDGGNGSAPDFQCDARPSAERRLPDAFMPFFASWHRAVEFLCLQHGAIAQAEDCGMLAHASIELPIDIGTVQPLQATRVSGGHFLEQLNVSAQPFMFAVPAVHFRVVAETGPAS